MVFLQRTDGTVAGVLPTDYLIWRQKTSQTATALDADLTRVAGVRGKELWLTGTASPLFQKNMAAKGWKIEDYVGGKLTLK